MIPFPFPLNKTTYNGLYADKGQECGNLKKKKGTNHGDSHQVLLSLKLPAKGCRSGRRNWTGDRNCSRPWTRQRWCLWYQCWRRTFIFKAPDRMFSG